jgi:predicted RNA-binding protein with RPS1 domain
MNKIKELIKLNDEKKTREEIEKLIGIRVTDNSILKKYLPEIKELINENPDQNTKKNIANLERKNEYLNLEINDLKKLKKDHEKLENNYEQLQKSYENIHDRFFSDLKKELAKNNEEKLKNIANYHLGKIDNEPVKTVWRRVTFSLFSMLLITLFFESYIIYGYETMHQYTPAEIKELEKYQVDKSLISKDNPNFIYGYDGASFYTKNNMLIGYVRWRR